MRELISYTDLILKVLPLELFLDQYCSFVYHFNIDWELTWFNYAFVIGGAFSNKIQRLAFAQDLDNSTDRIYYFFFLFPSSFLLDISGRTFCVSKRTQQWNISDRCVFLKQDFCRGKKASNVTYKINNWSI